MKTIPLQTFLRTASEAQRKAAIVQATDGKFRSWKQSLRPRGLLKYLLETPVISEPCNPAES